MERRRYLAVLGSVLPLAGCTGGPGDQITMLAVNQDDVSHVVAVWVVRGEKLTVANTVEVPSGDTAQLGQMPWKRGQYRVTVQVDGDSTFAEKFQSEDWFNQLDVLLESDGSADLNRGRAA